MASNLPVCLVFVVVLGGLVGAFWGRIPYLAATERGNESLAWWSVGTCVVLGMVSGSFAAAVAAYVFKAVIVANGPVRGARHRGYDGLAESDYQRMVEEKRAAAEEDDPAADEPYREIGPVVTCNDCGHASARDPHGDVPEMCPQCGLRFRRKKPPLPVAHRAEPPVELAPVEPPPPPQPYPTPAPAAV